MTGLQQTLWDLKVILSTDRRIWAAGIFIVVVTVLWGATGSWRETEEVFVEDYVKIKIKPEKVEDMVEQFNKDMRESQEEQRFLSDYAKRVVNQLDADRQEIDWHVNTLVTRLNDMTEKVDDIANKVGEQAIKKAEFELKLKRQKKNRKKKRVVDNAEL